MRRCKSEGPKAKLQERIAQFLQDKEHKFYEEATRLQMKISFEAHDFYATGVFYYNSCYIKFSIKKKVTFNKHEQMENLQNDILEEFLLGLKKPVIIKNEAFLLSDPLDDIKRLSIENGLEDALIIYTRTLRLKIAR